MRVVTDIVLSIAEQHSIMQKSCLLVLFALLLNVSTKVSAILPADCTDSQSINSGECCPNNCFGPRGSCESITIVGEGSSGRDPAERNISKDIREQWPYFYKKACKCNGNYGDYDCSGCRFGYQYNPEDNSCNKVEYTRRSVLQVSISEWREYIDVLKTASRTRARYKVFTTENVPFEDYGALSDHLYRPTLTELYAWVHHYAAKDVKETKGKIDYAHQKLGFPTWHRLYLLWVENEIRITLNKPNFTLIYWDWTNPMETELILTTNRLGESVGGMVKGDLFDEGWEVICWNTTEICDPEESSKTNLTRCENETKCSVKYHEWPTKENVTEAVDIESYTEYPYDRNAVNSFSNRLEGFIPQNGTFGKGLHNIVHLILNGTMGDITISASDPIFLNHHSMVDSILEKWIKKHSKTAYPTNIPAELDRTLFIGHRAEDYIVPFYPLFTHRDMFKEASELGYQYEYNDGGNNNVAAIVVPVIAGVVVLVLVVAIVILYNYLRKHKSGNILPRLCFWRKYKVFYNNI